MLINPKDYRLDANDRAVLVAALRDYQTGQAFKAATLRARKDAWRESRWREIERHEMNAARAEDLIAKFDEEID